MLLLCVVRLARGPCVRLGVADPWVVVVLRVAPAGAVAGERCTWCRGRAGACPRRSAVTRATAIDGATQLCACFQSHPSCSSSTSRNVLQLFGT